MIKKNELLLLDDWLQYKVANEGKSESTAEKYRGHLILLLEFLQCPFADAKREQLLQFTGIYLHKQGMAPRSRRVVVAAVRGFYSWLEDWGKVNQNPAAQLVYPKESKKIPRALGLKNAERLLMQPDIGTFAGVRDAAILSLFMGCGFRLSGLINLNESNLIWFEYKGIERLAIKTREKGDKERVIPVPNEAALLVKAYIGHPELRMIDRYLDNGDQVLFVSLRNRTIPEYDYRGENRRLGRSGLTQMIKHYAEQADIPMNEAHPHAMRHLLGTELAEESASSLEIMAVLGHSNADTSSIYTHMALRKLTQVIDDSNPLGKINTVVSPLVKQMKAEGLL